MSATTATPGPATVAPAAREHARYGRVAAAGLLFLGLSPLVAFAAAVASGMELGGEGITMAVAAIVPLIAAALAWRYGTWSKIVAIVVALLMSGGLFFIAFGLAFPASFGDFVPAVCFVVGFLLTIGGAIAAIVQRRRGHVAAALSVGERRVLTGATAVVAVAAVASGLLAFFGTSAAVGATGTPVTMADFSFGEASYTVPGGNDAALVVHNGDGFMHDVTVPELGIEHVAVPPGTDRVVDLSGVAPGRYVVYCSLHSDTSNPVPAEAGMATVLIVK